jgi:hypothetical protein
MQTTTQSGIMEKGRNEKYRKGKMSKAINVSDGVDVRIKVRVEMIFSSI